MKITIAGTGYVGLSNAVLLAQHNQVVAIDIVAEKVAMLNRKQSPIEDAEIEDYLQNKPLNLRATLNKQEAYEGADFVIATGVQYTVRQFIEKTAAALSMQLRWEGSSVNEVGYWNDQPIIRIDPRYFRPTEVETLLGDPSKAKEKLGWMPEITLDEMVQEMVAADLADAKKHALLKHHGYNVNVSVE